MKYMILSVFTAFLLNAAMVHAEIYKYMDEAGNLHFTDNIAEVPEAQQKDVSRYKEIPPEPETGSDEQASLPADSDTTPVATAAAALAAEQAELNTQKEKLQAEKAALGKPPSAADPEARRVYMQKVNDLNQKINAYDKKNKAYAEKVVAFNQKSKNPETQKRTRRRHAIEQGKQNE